MTLAEIRQEIEFAEPGRLRTLAIALCDHIVDLHQSFKVISLEAKIGLKEDVHIKDQVVWPGDW